MAKIYDVEYNVKGQNETLSFEVINQKKQKKPQTLFKYYALNENSIDALLNSYIYATHPNQFNDVFDCFINLIKFDDVEMNKNFLKNFYKLTDDKIEEIANNTSDIQKKIKKNLFNFIGLISLTNDDNNILMWSYYTNHQGFCINFDYKLFPFKFHGPFPINYQKKVKPISIKDELKSSFELASLIQTNIKFKNWEHEDEWRLLIESPSEMVSPFNQCGHNRKFKYPISAIKSITLGMKFFDFHNEIDKFTRISDNEMDIEIKKNIREKSMVLDFIERNKITAILTNEHLNTENVFTICNVPFTSKKVNTNTYKFKSITH